MDNCLIELVLKYGIGNNTSNDNGNNTSNDIGSNTSNDIGTYYLKHIKTDSNIKTFVKYASDNILIDAFIYVGNRCTYLQELFVLKKYIVIERLMHMCNRQYLLDLAILYNHKYLTKLLADRSTITDNILGRICYVIDVKPYLNKNNIRGLVENCSDILITLVDDLSDELNTDILSESIILMSYHTIIRINIILLTIKLLDKYPEYKIPISNNIVRGLIINLLLFIKEDNETTINILIKYLLLRKPVRLHEGIYCLTDKEMMRFILAYIDRQPVCTVLRAWIGDANINELRNILLNDKYVDILKRYQNKLVINSKRVGKLLHKNIIDYETANESLIEQICNYNIIDRCRCGHLYDAKECMTSECSLCEYSKLASS